MSQRSGGRAHQRRLLSRRNRHASRSKSAGANSGRALRIETLELRAMMAAFNAGDLVVDRIGDGSGALTSGSTPVAILEYTSSTANQAAPVQTINLPNTATRPSANPFNLTESGTATSDGFISRSTDGTALVIPGYNGINGDASIASSASATIKRVVGEIGVSGVVDTSRAADMLGGNNFRSVATTNGTDIWDAGAGGFNFYNNGTPVTLGTGNARVINIFNNQLYVSSSSASFNGASSPLGIWKVGSGTPTSGTPTLTNVFSDVSGSSSPAPSPYDFAFSADGNTAYLTDDRSIANGGGIQKWTFNGSTWSLAYTLGTGSGSTVGARGLVVDFSGANPVVYATTAEAPADRLIKIIDTGAVSAATTLATAATNTIFRGVDFAPVTAAATLVLNHNSGSYVQGATDALITTANLQATEAGQPTSAITFNVTSLPAHGTIKKGAAVLAINSTFTQQDIDNNLIKYTNDNSANTTDSFNFTVSDVFSATVDGAYNITIAQAPSIALNRTMTVNPDQTVTISDSILAAADADTAAAGLVYTVTAGPSHGSLAKNGSAISSFTQADLNANDTTANAIRYTTIGNPGDSDTITVSLSDGTTTITGIVINISIVAPIAASYTGGTYSQDFDDLLPAPVPTDSSTLPSAMVLPDGWSVVENGFGAGSDNSDSSIRIDNGATSTGDTDLYGATGSNERALGSISSGSLASKYGVALVNNTGSTISSFTLSYTGEQWRDGGSTSAILNKLSFEYSATATSLTDGEYIADGALDFTAPHNNNTADAVLDGNDSANQTALTDTISGLTWAPGQTLFLRWTDLNETGNDDGLAIDGLTFSTASIADTPPEFTSTATPSVNENSTAVVTLAATDPEAPPQVVTFSITGGADQGKFSINGGNQLVFNAAPDFEAPTDTGHDNVYEVEVTADDGAGGTTAQELSVSINPLSEGDFNHNGIVDAADYTVWRDHLEQNVTPFSGADGDGNGIVQQADYTVWLNHFGTTQTYAGAGAGSGASTAVASPVAVTVSNVAAPVSAKLVVAATPVASTPAVATSTAAHDEAVALLTDQPVAPTHHRFGSNGSSTVGSQSSGFRAAWLKELLLNHADGPKQNGTASTKHAGRSTSNSGDADATDECFASLGSGKLASSLR